MTHRTPHDPLRELLSTPGRLVRLAGAHNPLAAKLVAAAGFDAVWASSLEISTACAVLDNDDITMTNVLSASRSMAEVVDCPVVADCGTGGRTPDDVAEMVKQFEAVGAAAVSIEDAQRPRRNSLLHGEHRLASTHEFARKITAACDARESAEFVVIARVEALIAGAGLDEALRRAQAYVSAGTDAILIHSKAKEPDEVLAFIEAWDRDVPLVLVPTTYSSLSEQQMLETHKVKMVIYANHGIRASLLAMQRVYAHIVHNGSTQGTQGWIASLDSLFGIQASFDTTNTRNCQ